MFEMLLLPCGDCTHLDLEHELLMDEDFTPIAPGPCNVCDCLKFTEETSGTPEVAESAAADVERRERHEEFLRIQGQSILIQKMIDNPDTQIEVNLVVIRHRVEFLLDLIDALKDDEVVDYPALVDACGQLIRDYRTAGRIADETAAQRWLRWKAIFYTTLAMYIAKLKVNKARS